MRKEKISLKIVACLILVLSIFYSCDKDDDEPVQLDAIIDVYAKKIVENNKAKTALVFWTKGNKNLKTVKVKAPESSGKTYFLTADKTASNIFRYTPVTSDYKSTKPNAGKYVFTVEGTDTDDSKLTLTDVLATDTLDYLTIKTTEFKSSKLKTIWEKVKNTQNYVVRLKDKSGSIIFNHAGIKSTTDNYSFGTSDKGWIGSIKAVKGTEYTLEVIAVLYEKGATSQNKGYNVQFISVANKSVTWK